MYEIGANTWIWTSPLNDERLRRLAAKVAEFGFDFIELPIEQSGDWDPRAARQVLTDHGLGATVCAVMPVGRDLSTSDAAIVEATQRYLRVCLDAAAELGATVVAGPIYAPVGHTPRLTFDEREQALERVAEALRPLASEAAARGIRLGLEPLNRFETSLVNTVEQALEIVERVDSPALGLTLDTFHLNIEERDPAGAIRRAGERLVHVQACGTDRGTPGGDHLDWPALAAALRGIGYGGAISIESFTPQNEIIARAASIWRPLAPSQDRLASDGLTFLRRLFSGEQATPDA